MDRSVSDEIKLLLADVVAEREPIVRCTTPSGQVVDFAYVPLGCTDTSDVAPEDSDSHGVWIRAKDSDMESHTVSYTTVRNLARRCDPDVEVMPYDGSLFPELTDGV